MSAERRIEQQSLVQLAAEAIREMILSGELRPGDHLVEERLTETLGISRPPLREAFRLLQREGLVVGIPRRGNVVSPLTSQDVNEIFTLRAALERLAMELAVPVRQLDRMMRCRSALEAMADSARREDRAGLVKTAFEFHLALVALAGNRRLEEMYHSLWLQMALCMAANTRFRESRNESLTDNVARHRLLLEIVESGELKDVLVAFEAHGDRAFFEELVETLAAADDAPLTR